MNEQSRVQFFDPLRVTAMVCVVLYHAVGAYSTVTPHWSVHDGTSVIADGIRHLFDVFMMPTFFFIAGFFAVPSLAAQGRGKFLMKKIRRIGVPWLLALFIIVPLTRYGEYHQANTAQGMSFLGYWIDYAKSIGTFQIGMLTPERAGQMHFWFLSLLLSFFILYGLFGRRFLGEMADSGMEEGRTSGRSTAFVLAVSVIATSLAYSAVLFVAPETSWITIDRLFQFQPTAVVVYIASFVVGCAAYSRHWFDDADAPGRPLTLLVAACLLTVAYFVIGHAAIFTASDVSRNGLSALPFLFSFVRTGLTLAIVMLLVRICRLWKRRLSPFHKRVASVSYEIYLVHIFFVVFLQHVLMIWQGGPPMVKALVALLVVLPVSYWVGLLVNRFPRCIIAGFCALFLLVAYVTR